MRRLTDRTIVERKFLLVGDDNCRLDVVAKLHSIDGQRPYFSVTSQRGSNHDDILRAAPELAPVVAMHLAYDNGFPVHFVENLVYHLKKGDMEVAHRHIRQVTSIEDLMILAGRAGMASKKVEDEAPARMKQERQVLQTRLDRFLDRERQAKLDGRTFFSRKDIEALEKEIAPIDTDAKIAERAKIEARDAYKETVSTFVTERCAATWNAQAADVKSFLEGPDYRSDAYVERDLDPTTYTGFAKAHSLVLEMVSSRPAPEGATTWAYRLTSPNGQFASTVTRGSALHGAPSIEEIIELLQSTVAGVEQPFEEWARDFGYDEDSRKGERIYRECGNIRLALIELVGADAFKALVENVGADLPMMGLEPEQSAPKL